MLDPISLLALAPLVGPSQQPQQLPLPQSQSQSSQSPQAAPALLASDPSLPPAAIGSAALMAERDRLHFDEVAGGSQWVRGRTYKASAGADGFTYIPFLGSDAPRNFPVRFELDRASIGGEALELAPGGAVHRDGMRFVLDRGPVEVRYDLGLDCVEQSFAVEAAGADGDMELVLAVTSELGGVPDGGQFRFEGPSGGVTYGTATVLDGAGRELAIPTHLSSGARGHFGMELTLTVPASFLRHAQGTVVVDPVIATYAVSTILGDQRDVDMAYDESTDRWVYVLEEQFSGSDVDLIVLMLRSSDGAYRGSRYVDMSSDPWENPSIASVNGANKCLIAAEVDTQFNRPAIRGRLYSPGTGAIEPAFTIDGSGVSNKHRPDVGGDPSNDPNGKFMAVWQAEFTSSGASWIFGRTVSPTGTLGPVKVLYQGVGGFRGDLPAISKAMGPIDAPDAWVLAYRVRSSSFQNVYWKSIDASGDPQGANQVFLAGGNITVTSLDVSDPVEFEGDRDHLVCVGQAEAGRQFLSLHRRDFFETTPDFQDMSIGEHSPMNRPRYEPHVATEDGRFLITYLEGTGNDFNAYLSIMDPVTGYFFGYSERRTRLGYLGQTFHPGGGVAIATKYSGGDRASRLSGLSWESTPGAHTDLIGVTHEAPVERTVGLPYCHGLPNSTGTRGFLSITGDESLTSPKRLVGSSLPPGRLGMFIVSERFATGVAPFALANGLCVGGSIARIFSSVSAVNASGTVSYVVDPTAIPTVGGTVPAMAGDYFVFQFWHRDVAGGAATYNFTNASQLYFF